VKRNNKQKCLGNEMHWTKNKYRLMVMHTNTFTTYMWAMTI
jgi:hypothetical protein